MSTFYRPSMTQTVTLFKMRVPPPLHETFHAVVKRARWDRVERVFIVRATDANLAAWQQFLDMAQPAMEVLEEVYDNQNCAVNLEQAEEAARTALAEAKMSLEGSWSRINDAERRLKTLTLHLSLLEQDAERVDAQWKKLQAELQQLEGPLRESIKPAVALCRAHDLQSALSELLRASWEGDGVAHQRAAQSRIRMLRDALRRIGFRNRWI